MAKKMKVRHGRKRSGSAKDFLLILIIVLILASLIAGIAYVFLNREKIDTNTADLCPKQGARATVAILLDTTDQISKATKRDIQKRARYELENLPRYYRLSLYTMSDQGLDLAPEMTQCNPGKLTEMSKLAQKGITANPRMIKEKYDAFAANISRATNKALNTTFDGKQSPLLSALQELSSNLPEPVVLDADLYPAGRNKIIYITDLMEHTDVFSIYRDGNNMKNFQDSSATEKYRKKYTEDLEFWVIKRKVPGTNTREIMDFWGNILIKEFGFPPQQNLNMLSLDGET